ncbi:MAG: hybrid sensor histidine kinase/response regulator [Arthrospira sp. PLM2.Bin9]|nr:hybrid sensor histidine kinase/response regulator [Arthrospira sp. PLM2.Bin9]TVU55094.1 MAG: hybrid sensor histidine kinase/response regulator [Arthrospira sp. PLM2.Bin9]
MLSILVIDDEPDNFDVIETFLSNQDYQLHYAASGQEGISALKLIQPDLILLDVMMPVLDGIEVCRRIKTMPQWQSTPIIMVTALSSKESLAKCIAAGADDFIGKPVNALELRSRVHSMLRIKQQYDQIYKLSNVQNNTIQLLKKTLDQLRGNLASSLSHELNTPLNGVLGMLALVMEDMEDIEDVEMSETVEMLGLAYQSACRLENLVKRFLIYLELELMSSEGKEVPPGSTILSFYLVEPICKQYAQDSQRYDDFKWDIEPATVAISERYLSIILHELIDNAVKFSKPGQPISIRSQIIGEKLGLWIHDLGRGMTEEQITQIGAFMQFERKNYEQQGIGIGLKIVNLIVELVGASIEIKSIYNQETTIYIALPIFH